MPDNDSNKQFVRLHFLDALRGYAAFYVVFYHMVLLSSPHLQIPSWLKLYISTGGIGVTLFFVLSAFALCYSMDLRKKQQSELKDFYIRRFFRIAPLFYLMMVFYYVRDIGLFGVYHDFFTVMKSALFVFNFSPSDMEGYVWASWTIGVEMLFYLVFPLIYRYTKDFLSALSFFFIAVLLSWAWGFVLDHYAILYGYIEEGQRSKMDSYSFLSHLPTFALGIVAYHLFNILHNRLNDDQKSKLGIVLLAFFAYMYTALMSGEIKGLWSGFVWQGLAYCVLLIGLGLAPLKTMVNNSSVKLGKMSYSLYLLHPTLVYLMSPIFQEIYAFTPSVTLAFLLCCMVTFIILSSMSFLTYHFVERKGVRFGEALIARYRLDALGSKNIKVTQ